MLIVLKSHQGEYLDMIQLFPLEVKSTLISFTFNSFHTYCFKIEHFFDKTLQFS